MSLSNKVPCKYPKNGEVLCGYKIGVTLGQGAFGKVKLATKLCDNGNRNEYAAKFIDKSQMDDLDDVERIYRESAILTSLKHPNIIRLYEVLDTAQWVLIIMDYANGGELKEFIASKPNNILPEHIACDIFNSTLNGLEYCHRRKVIHRDLKLENILIDTNGTIRIADFGLSATIQFGKQINTSCGTPSYIAPEIIRGDFAKHNDSKSNGAECDIWSLGVILFSMICGFLPFEAPNIRLLYNKICKADCVIPRYVSLESKQLIEGMLTVDIEERITLSQIRNHKWTQMRVNGLISDTKLKKTVSAQQIESAAIFNLTRKKPKINKTVALRVSVESSEDEPILFDKHSAFKHSKSLDRELAIYLQSKSRVSTQKSPSSNKSHRKSAIKTLKQKLSQLKMSKTPRIIESLRKQRSKSKKKERHRSKTPPSKRKRKSENENILKTPNNNKAKNKKSFHSPIVDSIMARVRKPNVSSLSSTDAFSDYHSSNGSTI